MSLEDIGKNGTGHANRLNGLTFGSTPLFHFISIIMAFLSAFIFGAAGVGQLINDPANNVILFLFYMVLASIYAVGNFATSQLLGLLLRGYDDFQNLGSKWIRNLIFISFTGVTFLSLSSLFFSSSNMGLINVVIIVIQVYIWLIFFSLRGMLKGLQDVDIYLKSSKYRDELLNKGEKQNSSYKSNEKQKEGLKIFFSVFIPVFIVGALFPFVNGRGADSLVELLKIYLFIPFILAIFSGWIVTFFKKKT